MPALQNLVLTDRQATPVAHTFIPRGISNDVATVVKAGASGSPLEEMVFSISHRRVNGRMKTVARLKVPVVTTETINGVSRIALLRESFVDVSLTFAADSTEAERNNTVGMMQSALLAAATLVNDTAVKGQGIY